VTLLPGWMPWLLVEMLTAGLAAWLWRQLSRIRRNVRHLLQQGKVDEISDGLPVIRATLQDLHRLEVRLREIGRQATEEDFSLRAILSSMVEGVMILDRQFRIRLLNQRLQDMFMLPRPPVGRTVMEVFRNHFLYQVIERTLQSGSAQSAELQIELREADRFTTRHFQVTSVGLRPGQEGGFDGILLVFHDISQIRSLEAVRKEFVANVSHELRTPLSILSGYLETLLEAEVDPETTRRFLETMYRHAKRLNALLENLLLLSQLESGRLPLHVTRIAAGEFCERALERFEPVIAGAGVAVTVSVPEGLSFDTDALRLEQALSNLIDNALKYGLKPGLHLCLAAELDGPDVVLRISDNGPGIPLRDQPHIFERFYRVHKDRSRDAGGTGLGMSIVKHTMQLLGGSVSVESSPGQGATFILRFPRGF
jgi:two-component system, OmpR family, phosphate regulon sensor histidine kinase PhoR